MTDRHARPERVQRLPLPIAMKWSIATAAIATFLIVGLLWVQLAAGRDPALGPKLARQQQTTTSTPAQTTLYGDGEVYGDDGYAIAPAPAPAHAPVQPSTS